MNLLTRLSGSFLVQEQEAAERIDELQRALETIRILAECTLFNNSENIIKVVDRVLGKEDGSD